MTTSKNKMMSNIDTIKFFNIIISLLCNTYILLKMIEYDQYKKNVEIINKFHYQDLCVDKTFVYNGNIGLLKKGRTEHKEKKDAHLAAAVLGINNTGIPLPIHSELHNIWTDTDAQELYVRSRPTCYLILNKPGAGAYTLGEAISKKYNCVHLCPRNIIIDEMDQQSLTGKCMDYNMRHNKVLKFDTILTILKMKLESPVIKNRGYVISGIPLVTKDRDLKYLMTSLYSEDSFDLMEGIMYDLICNMKKKKSKPPKTDIGSNASVSYHEEMQEEAQVEEEQLEAGEEEEEPQLTELPKFILEPCSNVIYSRKPYYDTKQSVLLQQLDSLFNLSIKPNIVLYMTCPDIDLVTKRSHKYITYTNGLNTVEHFDKKIESEIRWPQKYVLSDYEYPHSQHIFNPKYNCRQPTSFVENVIEQLCNYKQNILPFLENKLKEFEPKHVIKLDARTSNHEIMHLITQTFIYLPIKPVLIPEPLYLEEPPDEIEEFWKFIEESNVIRDGGVNFNRFASPWYNRCPVELKNRQSVRGKPKLAVSFFKHVYLLSSPDAVISFCRNPRPYLKLRYLEPTCRVITIGTKSSGKTMVSKCLSWLFDTPIICFKSLEEVERKKKYERFSENVLSEISATIEDARLEKWHNIENERINQLDMWYLNVSTKLKEYIPLLSEILNYAEKQKAQQIKEELKKLKEQEEYEPLEEEHEIESVSEDSLPQISQETLNNFNEIHQLLSFLPFLNDIETCEAAVSDKQICIQYAPQTLTTATKIPSIPCLGEEDVTEAIKEYIITNDLQKEVEPTIEELMTELIKILSEIDTTAQEATKLKHKYGKYIIDDFPSNPEYWDHLRDQKFLPDYTIAIIENREINEDILEHYANVEKATKNYYSRFMLAKDPLMRIKRELKGESSTEKMDVNVDVGFDSLTKADDVEKTPTDESPSFAEKIEKFKEDWDSIKLKLEDKYKVFIEVEIEAKTDVAILEEVLLKLRTGYCVPPEINEGDEAEGLDDEEVTPKDLLVYNQPQFLGDTNVYGPIAYHKDRILWEGKPEFSVKCDNRLNYFSKEENMQQFLKDITLYQYYNFPFKDMPALKICVIGTIGSGKTTISKYLAKELGLLHIDYAEAINDFMKPRHMKRVGRQYENAFTDTPMDEGGAVDFQMSEENENLLSDILSNETELRRMIYEYFERGTGILPVLTQKLIKKLWFDEPFWSTGFVLDGFPRLPTEVEDMMPCNCIPDLVIQLDSDSETALKRMSPIMFKMWKSQLNDAKAKAKEHLVLEKQEWLKIITRNVVIKLICEEILENVFFAEPTTKLSAQSFVMDANPAGDAHIDTKLFNTYNEIVQENPEPTDQNVWEHPDEARERIDMRLEGIYEVDDENIQNLNEALLEQKIKVTNINSTKPLIKVLRLALSNVTNLRNRNQSFFEQTFIISCDIAEMLLSHGYYFFSKFNRMCPVYVFENPHAISNPYKINKVKNNVFAILHRAYVYFINGKDNVIKFRNNPLLYVEPNNIRSFLEYSVGIGIIGPPKSGKSSLAAKIAKKYGFLCLSRGVALRHVLENFHWTELASRIVVALRNGECISSDIVMKAVHATIADHRVVTHGFVFDGFPETPSEAMELEKVGLYPLIIFDIDSNVDKIVRNSQNECYIDILKRKPPYSIPFINHRFDHWQKRSYSVRGWINDDYQNMYVINGNISKWQCLQEAEILIKDIVLKVYNYIKNVNSGVVSMDGMCISNATFERRMSNYKNLCPLCLRKNVLRHSSFPVDRKGILQFRNELFWVCEDHKSDALKLPHLYLVANYNIRVPEIPAVIKTVNPTFVYEKGICIVTYADNLPGQKIVRGDKQFAASYRGNSYLFCEAKCLEKFLAKPHAYWDITVFKLSKPLPVLDLNQLPNLGYLEQSVGNIITKACCMLNALRPKYPGLSIQVSGLIYIGVYLKSHNHNFDDTVLNLYMKILKTYEARCKLMIDIGLRLRSRDNPFAEYPKCCGDVLRKAMSDTTAVSHSSLSILSHSNINMGEEYLGEQSQSLSNSTNIEDP
ncbi:adenylate kinase 9-like [Plodia interpunctella]|uniref:adenylate kinase 9-like n=1 Tax=Plodia interpunctella TaxID=58824 RepID=UPI0023674554|nr:adenylate kinase 9 isoform X1 [Plodia interpunctella]